MGSQKVVAIDIGGTKIASALVTLEAGRKPVVEFYEKIPTEAKRGGQVVLANAIKMAERVIELAGGAENLAGIGVSSGGVIDPRTGDVTYANDMMPGWGGTHLGSELTAATGLPARVLNDVHAHALGEARWGAGVERGLIMLGAHNEAGHIGHVSCSDAAGIPCQCGAVGHMETIACGPGIIERYLELGGDPTDEEGKPVDGAVIDKRAAAGDEAAIAAEARSGHAIGEVLGSLSNMLDPECIILSGSVALCGPAWHDAMDAGWREAAMPPVAATPIVSGDLGGDAPLIGAAENIVKSAYAD